MINQLYSPVSFSVIHSFYQSKIRSDSVQVMNYENIPKNFTALDYVNISNMVVNQHSEEDSKCTDFAKETFNVYQELVKSNDRKDLEDDIRLAAGFYGYTLRENGHEWVEVKHKGDGRAMNQQATPLF